MQPVSAVSVAEREALATQVFRIVALLTGVQIVFNIVMTVSGSNWPATGFLLTADDNFGDFFGLMRSYPGGEVARVDPGHWLAWMLPERPPSATIYITTPYGRVTNFHLMPLTTMISVLTLRLISLTDPVAIFLASSLVPVLAWWLIVRRFAVSAKEALMWLLVGLIAYPTLFMFQRANHPAALCALAITAASVLGLKRTAPVAAAILLAFAVNIRPNAIVFAGPLLLFYWAMRVRFAVALGVAGFAILGISIAANAVLYPEWTFAAFRLGLQGYVWRFAINDWGLPFGASLYAALRTVLPHSSLLATGTTLASFALIGIACAAHALRRLSDSALWFVTVVGYMIGTTIFADYHLMILLSVPLVVAHDRRLGEGTWATVMGIIVLATAAILAPKQYLFFPHLDYMILSAQIVLNPLIAITAALAVLALSWPHRLAERPIAA